MKVIVCNSYEQAAEKTAELIAQVIREKANAKLGLATGSTPVPVYRRLIALNKAGELDFSRVRTVNLDEYVGLEPQHPQSYRHFMNENLFNHINIEPANTFVASGLGNALENAKELDEKVFEGGVTDIQLLGIGNNGHVGFNEAGGSLTAESHIEHLTESTIKANARFFENEAEVPTQAITMGMYGILAAKKLVLLATGEGKAPAMKGLLEDGKVSTLNPATFLKLHADATIVIDKALAGLCGYAI